MKRPDYMLHELDVNEWTEQEVFSHLTKTFEDACRDYPDIMEPYAIRCADALGKQETKQCMREALRETFTQRWPNRHAKSEAAE